MSSSLVWFPLLDTVLASPSLSSWLLQYFTWNARSSSFSLDDNSCCSRDLERHSPGNHQGHPGGGASTKRWRLWRTGPCRRSWPELPTALRTESPPMKRLQTGKPFSSRAGVCNDFFHRLAKGVVVSFITQNPKQPGLRPALVAPSVSMMLHFHLGVDQSLRHTVSLTPLSVTGHVSESHRQNIYTPCELLSRQETVLQCQIAVAHWLCVADTEQQHTARPWTVGTSHYETDTPTSVKKKKKTQSWLPRQQGYSCHAFFFSIIGYISM